MFKTALERWKIFNHIITDATVWTASLLFYFTVMVPFGIGVRLLGDPLTLKGAAAWLERKPVGTSLEDARRQG